MKKYRTQAYLNRQLRLAAQQNNVKRIHALIKEGAMVNSVNPEGASAIMLAAKAQSHDSISVLLSCGANVDLRDKRGAGLEEYQFPKEKVTVLSEVDRQTLRVREQMYADHVNTDDPASKEDIKRGSRAL